MSIPTFTFDEAIMRDSVYEMLNDELISYDDISLALAQVGLSLETSHSEILVSLFHVGDHGEVARFGVIMAMELMVMDWISEELYLALDDLRQAETVQVAGGVL